MRIHKQPNLRDEFKDFCLPISMGVFITAYCSFFVLSGEQLLSGYLAGSFSGLSLLFSTLYRSAIVDNFYNELTRKPSQAKPITPILPPVASPSPSVTIQGEWRKTPRSWLHTQLQIKEPYPGAIQKLFGSVVNGPGSFSVRHAESIKFSRTQFEQLRDKMVDHNWLEWGANRRDGVHLTELGEKMVKAYVKQLDPPTLEADAGIQSGTHTQHSTHTGGTA